MMPEATLESVFCNASASARLAAPTTAKIEADGMPIKPKAVMMAKMKTA